MTTFSQLVDELVVSTGRINQQRDIQAFVNQVIRECHADERGRPYIFARNLIEDTLTATVETGQTWEPPMGFQVMQTARYGSIANNNGQPIYPKFQMPGRRLNQQRYYYYRSGTSFIFAEYGGVGSTIDLAYYVLPLRLGYFAPGSRPATYDDATRQFTYFDLTGTGGLDYTQPDNQEAARNLVTNWVLLNWPDVVRWGVRASIYPVVGDARSTQHFAKFNILRNQLILEEQGQVLDPNSG